MISGFSDKNAWKWDVKGGRENGESQNVREVVTWAVAVSRDGRWVVTAGYESTTPSFTQSFAITPATFVARIPYLSSWWPVHGGYAQPSIVGVSLAQAKEYPMNILALPTKPWFTTISRCSTACHWIAWKQPVMLVLLTLIQRSSVSLSLFAYPDIHYCGYLC
ncbi:hypothetical protein EDD22DRAFT_919081 [Suillus occidentalis]|nr:hypothetical protein EDD22DRAFT_919081 [Suillus occidentalis]